jgi:competence protein ComEC
VVCTQPQADHITGLLEVLQRYKVKWVLEPGVSYNTSIYQEWCNLVVEKYIKRNKARAGQEIDLGREVKIEMLNPPATLFRGTSGEKLWMRAEN